MNLQCIHLLYTYVHTYCMRTCTCVDTVVCIFTYISGFSPEPLSVVVHYSFHSEHYALVLCTTSSKPSTTPSILNYRYYMPIVTYYKMAYLWVRHAIFWGQSYILEEHNTLLKSWGEPCICRYIFIQVCTVPTSFWSHANEDALCIHKICTLEQNIHSYVHMNISQIMYTCGQ